MQGGGVQDILDNYVASALSQVERSLDDEMQRMDNLGVRRDPRAPSAQPPPPPPRQRSGLTSSASAQAWPALRPGQHRRVLSAAPPRAECSAAAVPLRCAGR